jgi:hypothetical protein
MNEDWKLSLEQRSDLTVSSGDAAELAMAVKHGADLRLYMTTDTYEETLYFQQTYAGEDGDCAGLMSHHHSYVHHGEDIDQPYLSIFRYDTSGAFSQVKWRWGDVRLDESQAYPYGVYRWYTCDRWRLVYEHDEHGNAIGGNLDELMENIRAGHTIQVGIRQLFGLASDDTGGPSHTSFVTTMQPVIRDGHVESNCDFVVIGAPRWPIQWNEGLHMAMMQPSTSGEILCFLAEPGGLPFKRLIRRRAMQWMVSERG